MFMEEYILARMNTTLVKCFRQLLTTNVGLKSLNQSWVKTIEIGGLECAVGHVTRPNHGELKW